MAQEHAFSIKNPGAFQAQGGVKNLFDDASCLGCQNNTHQIFDEENIELNKKEYSNEYEKMVEQFGSHRFSIRYLV